MSDLVEFLRARLDEDERHARDEHEYRLTLSGTGVTAVVPPFMADGTPGDTARMLREVEAKRRMLEVHGEPDEDYTCPLCMPERGFYYPCRTLCLLALPYADHEDFRDEWQISASS